jgi:hypothetical protein
VDLRLRLGRPARLRAPDLRLDVPVQGHAAVSPHLQELTGGFSFGSPTAGPAPLQLVGGGNWSEGRWRGSLLSRRFDLAQLTRSLSLDGRKYDIACGQIDIGNAATEMTARMTKGVPQANGELAIEPVMDAAAVADSIVHMAGLPLSANVQFLTVMATKMPFIGRG